MNKTPLKKLLDLIVLIGLMLCICSAHASRLALVIGNDQYEAVEKLHNARNDANLMAQTLRDAQFDVTVVQNVDRKRFFAELDQLQRRINKGDDVVFYFAGHGVQIGSNPVLLPVDVRATTDREAEREGVPLLDVQDALKDARVSLLVIDACRDNPFPKNGTRSIGATRGLAPPEAARGQAIIMSAGRGQKALDTVPGETSSNGLFTREFVQVLRQPGLEVRAALQQVRDRVEDKAARANHDQRPSLVDDLKGNFYLFGEAGVQVASVRPDPVVVPPAAPSVPMPAPSATPPGPVFKDCDVCPPMVWLPKGRFTMGSPGGESDRSADEGPQHVVAINYKLAVGQYAVTFDEWQACVNGGGCGNKPDPYDGGWGRGTRPVINVSWSDAQAYVQWLSSKTGRRYRLLSEAEWEYAARAGTTTPYFTGRCLSTAQANYDGSEGNSACGAKPGTHLGQTQPVGSYAPNAFGLYDMAGNVYQWVEDIYHDGYSGAPTDGSAWVSGGDSSRRVLRGGSWYDAAKFARSALRRWDRSSLAAMTGFRVARAE